MEWKYTINPYSAYPILQLNTHIGFDKDDGQGIDGNQFANELFEIDTLNPILVTIYVNSLGGDVKQGYAILNAISSTKMRIKVVISGFAYSTAGWCILGADEIEVRDYSTFMCHLPYKSDSTETNKFIDTVANSIATILSSRSGRGGAAKKSEEEVAQMMKKKTYLKSTQMIEEGFADKIVNCEIKLNSDSEQGQYREYQQILNKELFKTSEPMAYAKVLNKLNLAEGSDEDQIVAGIARLENDRNVLNQEKTDLTNKLKSATDSQQELQQKMLELQNSETDLKAKVSNKETELSTIQNQLKDAQDALKKLETEKEEAINKEKEAANNALKLRADELIDGFVQMGKVENKEEVVNVWKRKAFEDFEGTKVILDAIKTNFTAPVVINHEKVEPKEVEEGSFEYFRLENIEEQNKRAELNKSRLEQTVK